MQFRVTRLYIFEDDDGRCSVNDSANVCADDIERATMKARLLYPGASSITVEVYDPYNCI